MGSPFARDGVGSPHPLHPLLHPLSTPPSGAARPANGVLCRHAIGAAALKERSRLKGGWAQAGARPLMIINDLMPAPGIG